LERPPIFGVDAKDQADPFQDSTNVVSTPEGVDAAPAAKQEIADGQEIDSRSFGAEGTFGVVTIVQVVPFQISAKDRSCELV
jgi:hypothetical protein